MRWICPPDLIGKRKMVNRNWTSAEKNRLLLLVVSIFCSLSVQSTGQSNNFSSFSCPLFSLSGSRSVSRVIYLFFDLKEIVFLSIIVAHCSRNQRIPLYKLLCFKPNNSFVQTNSFVSSQTILLFKLTPLFQAKQFFCTN